MCIYVAFCFVLIFFILWEINEILCSIFLAEQYPRKYYDPQKHVRMYRSLQHWPTLAAAERQRQQVTNTHIYKHSHTLSLCCILQCTVWLSFTVCVCLSSALCLTASLPPLPPLLVLLEREHLPPLPQVSAVGWHVDPPSGAPSTGVSSVTVYRPPMDLRPRRPPSVMTLERCRPTPAAGPPLTCSANSPPNSHAGKRRSSHNTN